MNMLKKCEICVKNSEKMLQRVINKMFRYENKFATDMQNT